jgi:hypothetical protein
MRALGYLCKALACLAIVAVICLWPNGWLRSIGVFIGGGFAGIWFILALVTAFHER